MPKAKGISSHFPINFPSEIELRSAILSYSINDRAIKVDKLASVDNGKIQSTKQPRYQAKYTTLKDVC